MAGLQKGRCVYGCVESICALGWARVNGFASNELMATKKKATKKAVKKGAGQACWPGFKRVAGTKAGAKGSCEPKAKQTASEKKADSRAAAARKREKAGQ
jgi:hypothetical protein